MKNKKLTYILGPLALVVWGLVIYRIIYYTGEEDTVIRQSKPISSFSQNQINGDSIRIVADYRDPFLASTNYNTQTVTNQNKNTNDKPDHKEIEVHTNHPGNQVPAMEYSGIVINGTGNKRTILLTVNTSECILQVNERCNNVTLLKISPDSILVEFNNKKMYIRRKGL